MRPEPLALTLDQTQCRTISELYGSSEYRARIAMFRDFLGLPVATYPARPWTDEDDAF